MIYNAKVGFMLVLLKRAPLIFRNIRNFLLFLCTKHIFILQRSVRTFDLKEYSITLFTGNIYVCK